MAQRSLILQWELRADRNHAHVSHTTLEDASLIAVSILYSSFEGAMVADKTLFL